jgi:hypothetical protein
MFFATQFGRGPAIGIQMVLCHGGGCSPAYTSGNSSRSLVCTPGIVDLSASLLKNFKIRERFNVQAARMP